ncbi:hypothetical protein PBY51_003521 [Eleginops maclovinus]|uniref:Uncharacterized protein n=1 Tax=Eleginops maclovinus TaxID=56733 RepID=A0AAN7Y103_ELEMC|nr:hypothetical protein PBY51_003521 [Eleginops maclovinus]
MASTTQSAVEKMSPMDCSALRYTLTHSDGVKLNLLWISILAESILVMLDKVSQLSLSHNNLPDASTAMLLQLVSINPSIHTTDKKFEIW